MKKFLVAALSLIFTTSVFAQTNLQVQYDFDRQQVTTTMEGFYNDNWGNTFFFIDHDFPSGANAMTGTYGELARCFNFWKDTKLAPLSVQAEYNGGVYRGYDINHAFLFGLDYFMHSKDFKNTCNFKVLFKNIMYNDPNTKSAVPLQFTYVWGCSDLFGVKGLVFSGFADFWWEEHIAFVPANQTILNPMGITDEHYTFLSEPQLWYNIGSLIDVPNLNIGGEVEVSYNFGTDEGLRVRPCAGIKWVF